MTIFSSRDEPSKNTDPEPWVYQDGTRSTVKSVRGDERGTTIHRARREFAPPAGAHGHNPILTAFRRRKAEAAEWARVLHQLSNDTANPRSSKVKPVLAACQLGPARLVPHPHEDVFVVKGPRSYEDQLLDALDHAGRVLTRLARFQAASTEAPATP